MGVRCWHTGHAVGARAGCALVHDVPAAEPRVASTPATAATLCRSPGVGGRGGWGKGLPGTPRMGHPALLKMEVHCRAPPAVGIHTGHRYPCVTCPHTSSPNSLVIDFPVWSFQVPDRPAEPLATAQESACNLTSGCFSFWAQCISRCTAQSPAPREDFPPPLPSGTSWGGAVAWQLSTPGGIS